MLRGGGVTGRQKEEEISGFALGEVQEESAVVVMDSGRSEELLGSATAIRYKAVRVHVDQCEVFFSLTSLISHNQPRIYYAFGQFTNNLVADQEHDKNVVMIGTATSGYSPQFLISGRPWSMGCVIS